ncbi:indolepyruvate oxidoreductase subunit beta [Desulfosporosinus sp. BICA1-9]|uniref:indolepyruvate oxidoreductase subunit beta n=1 Tax=Desulfosporosinus sp. BICA1-9 TaxID=1531958 RepID=UPI00054BC573|nr:indolepyruvate oxidoreductase subunit beta [Desulfosporosinus sp. BICA1-9]KJS47151.1 MAG: indolepyruvate oxidoreductase subunit beta [Peptococcaceae bacterium BRH_c23]KJS85986.1 MAG: indolepyruvate oxidoreductase subunit beta [Desulfosporosinus sp. BICA1-9]HBW34408.1 indolepyruvate oxidoreductase subunit beta [Desulfosporosinus sp.]
MSKIINVLLVGVGGQGTILASKILTHVALAEGYQVKMSEIHGMAQRGGSVVTQVRMGEDVYSPVIEPGEADFLIAFEQLEAYRWSHYLKKDGVLIVNTQKIVPLPVLIGSATYPETILVDLKGRVERFVELDGLKLASDAGNAKATNVVLMGVLSQYMDFPEDAWQSALVEKIPAKLLELNKRAFASGVALVK